MSDHKTAFFCLSALRTYCPEGCHAHASTALLKKKTPNITAYCDIKLLPLCIILFVFSQIRVKFNVKYFRDEFHTWKATTY